VEQHDWDTPRCADWLATLDRELERAAMPVVLAAHSLGCALVAHWARRASASARARVQGALLVAPSDVEAPSYPAGTSGFTPMPLAPLPFPTIVVASSDDMYVSIPRATEFARAWRARLVNVGPRGHLGSAARLERWPEGESLLEELLARP
jgi:predicted alpha/beta hydrolase family esterase